MPHKVDDPLHFAVTMTCVRILSLMLYPSHRSTILALICAICVVHFRRLVWLCAMLLWVMAKQNPATCIAVITNIVAYFVDDISVRVILLIAVIWFLALYEVIKPNDMVNEIFDRLNQIVSAENKHIRMSSLHMQPFNKFVRFKLGIALFMTIFCAAAMQRWHNGHHQTVMRNGVKQLSVAAWMGVAIIIGAQLYVI